MSAKKQSGSKKTATTVKTPPAKEKAAPKPGPDFFERPGRQVWYLFLGILVCIAFIVFKDYLLFHKLFLFKDIGSDTLNTFYPNLVESSEYLKKFGTLSWSFNIGMGQDGTTFAIGDPFNFILYLFPTSKVAWLLGYKEFVKIVLAGSVFCLYLRSLGVGLFPAVAGALMFAFSGYMIVGGQWYTFSFEALNMAFALLSFEFLFRKNIPWFFPVSYFLMGIYSPFNMMNVTVFLVIYTVFRYQQENREGVKGLMVLFLKMAGLGVIGVAMSAPAMFESVKVMVESARVSGPESYFATLSSSPVFGLVDPLQLGTCVMRFFSSDMLGTADAYKGLDNYLEGPLFYCGIPCLLLVPLLFGYLEKKQRILFGVMLAIWLLPIFFPYFRKAFWFFSGDYYRTYSLYVALIFIIFSVTCLDKLAKQKHLNIILLASVAISLILIQLFPYFDDKRAISSGIASGAKIYVLAYAVVFFWMSRQKNDIPKFVFLFILVTELSWFSSVSVNRGATVKSSEWKDKTGYNDYSNDAIAFIKNKDASPFYRVDKSFGSSPAEHVSLNDAMVQGYYSTSSYYSFNQKYYLQYMRTNQVISPNNESESRWCNGLINRPILQCLNSDKYILAKEPMYGTNDPIHDSIAKFGDVIVYKNKFPLPLGFCYDKYIKYSNFEKFSLTQKDFTSCRAAVINDADTALVRNLKEIGLQDSLLPFEFTQAQLKGDLMSLKQDTLNISSFNPAHIKGSIGLKSEKLMYLSIPYDIGWHIKVDGTPQTAILIGNGMMGILLKPGKHQVELDYEPPYRKESGLLAITGLLLYGGLAFGNYKMRKRASDKKQE